MKKVICIGGCGSVGLAHTVKHSLLKEHLTDVIVVGAADIETSGLERSKDSEILTLAVQLNELTELENRAIREAEPFILHSQPKIDMPFMKPLKLSKNDYRHKYGYKK